ncbi:hypothetical protein KK083_04270 [Fulvivirgaceae bacterium PWU4]|uniref:Uncharacterized protein n=1 Tax=Chryseosolibacter histidini TaxID=2782349 RepID=A0AAP2DI93_9BACT|nr:hypothetical protein [Chryseosolibacter histidini]MBT1696079.1 hypothetical protein [Chryseosolibacter histidini]
MEQYFLFQYPVRAMSNQHRLVIFCAGTQLYIKQLKKQLREFFSKNLPPNEIYIIGGDYLKDELTAEFISKRSEIFDVIRSFETTGKQTKILCFSSEGNMLDLKNNLIDSTERDTIFKQGIVEIFNTRGGLINSPSDSYHYIFPSGKHSSKFIRAGNVLVDGSEIFFIATTLLRYFKDNYTQIYCDTSSINSLAFALIELLKRFKRINHSPSILSFGSYDKFEKFDFSDSRNALILISASTSGNILRRLMEYHPNLLLDNILILFYLSDDREFISRVICDLTLSPSNPDGISLKDIYPNELDCDLCKDGSYKVKISGDVFLLEKPQIIKILIGVRDAPVKLSAFMQEFHSRANKSAIRCFFGEEPSRIFEHFIDTSIIEKLIDEEGFETDGLFSNYRQKYARILHQNIPSQMSYIIHLPDRASKLIAERIKSLHQKNSNNIPTLIASTDLLKDDYPIKNDAVGALIIACSCLVSGSNLLYVNKFLRRHEKLTKTFLIGFARPASSSKLDFVIKNISQGDMGVTQIKFVEKIFCSDYSENTNDSAEISWLKEMEMLKVLKGIIDENQEFQGCLTYVNERLRLLQSATDLNTRGLVNDVFLKNPITNQRMEIAKNFAFFNFDGYHGKASQADIYFTISCILNNLRSSDDKERRIIQEEYKRVLLDPDNFTRFDDGVIQASFLRTSKPEEINYQLDVQSSDRMKNIIFKMIEGHKDIYTSEALIEFLFAIGTKKLKLFIDHITEIVQKVNREVKNDTLLLYNYYIEKQILKIKQKEKSLSSSSL